MLTEPAWNSVVGETGAPALQAAAAILLPDPGIGADDSYTIIYSSDPDADRAFLRDVLEFPSVDVGGGWLIFGLPPAEVAVHPAEKPSHELYLMCDDIAAVTAMLDDKGVAHTEVEELPWGLLTPVAW